MNYGFVIDNRRCIGCHACSTACKSENRVPLGVNRTWVKYVEAGSFPNSRRHFQVTRCNHCANPPCVRICPVTAMYQRADGIVEFDPDVCIGCKACLQACPYDAIYIDPESKTAAKCHFCAHRIEVGLEPACAVVCPTEAIRWGDLDDPASDVSRLLVEQKVTVRKPEQGTAPKLFYVDGADVTLHPTATQRAPSTFSFADVLTLDDHGVTLAAPDDAAGAPLPRAERSNPHHQPPKHDNPGHGETRKANSGVSIRTPQSQGTPAGGPIQVGGRMAEQMVQVAYNAQHRIPWHWPVPAYLVTKGLAAGVFILLSLALGLGWAELGRGPVVLAGLVSLVFVAATTGLLVYDLEQPLRFLSILRRPQWKSWLARGAVILVGFSTVTGLWWLLEAGALLGVLPEGWALAARPVALWAGLPLAVGVAIYTAFLFAQAEGRDLWQSSLLPVHLLVQAVMMGGAAFLILDLVAPISTSMAQVAVVAFGVSLGLDVFLMLAGELGIPHASELAARAAHDITHGRYRRQFWWGTIGLGHVVPLLLLALGGPLLSVAGALAIVGLYLYEHAFVMAPQRLPNS